MGISENSNDTTSSVVMDNNTTVTYNVDGDRDKIGPVSQNKDANPNLAQVYAKIDITLHFMNILLKDIKDMKNHTNCILKRLLTFINSLKR